MHHAHEFYMSLALEQAEIAREEGNDGVGAVIVRDGVVIGRGRNLMYTCTDRTAHAEIVAIRDACKETGQLEFQGATLYCTMEPCPMCAGAIEVAGITTLVLGSRWTQRPHGRGAYTTEKFLELAGRADRIRVVTGVLADEGQDVAVRARAERAAKSAQ